MQRYPLIDLARGIAALLVVVYHVIEVGAWTTFPYDGYLRVFRIGWIGVDLFFVISGFVIGLSAMQSASVDPQHWRRPFADRRLRRIMPLYLLSSIAYLVLTNPYVLTHGWRDAAVHVGTHLLFVHNLLYKTFNSINPPTWSIALEMQFYLLILLTGAWLARTTLWRMLLLWVGIALAWRFATTLYYPPGPSDTVLQFKTATQLPGVLDAFGLGIGLAKLSRSGRLIQGWKPFLWWSIAAMLLLSVAWMTFWLDAVYWDSRAMIIGWRILLPAGFAALLGALIVCPTNGGWLTWPLRYFGVISYGIYLWHYPIVLTFVKQTTWRGGDLLLAVLLATILLAVVSWHEFEKLWLKPGSTMPPQAARSL